MGRGTGKRHWAVFGEIDPELTYPDGHPKAGQYVRVPVNPAAVEAKAADVANVVTMVGGTALMIPEREISPLTGMWETVAVFWEWHSYAPPAHGEPQSRGKRGGQQERQPAPAPAQEFQQPGPEPQEPEPDEIEEDDIPDDEFKELSPAEQAFLEREGALN